MTLIIKELVIRGIVSSDHSTETGSINEKEHLPKYLEQMKKEIREECLELIQKKLEASAAR